MALLHDSEVARFRSNEDLVVFGEFLVVVVDKMLVPGSLKL